MKETYWGYWLIMLGVFIIIILMLVSNVTTKNTQDYYLIKEVTQAAMVDAINYGYYREYGELKIDREVFIEAFIRRFSENVNLNTYYIDFYDLYEAPPKVSVRVTSSSNTFNIMGDQASFDIVNKVDAILELLPQNGQLPTSSSASNSSSSSNSSSATTNNNSQQNTNTPAICRSLNNTSLSSYILQKANTNFYSGYYTSDSDREKTSLGNMQHYVCDYDYADDCGATAEQIQKCKDILKNIYDSLPNTLK